MEAKTTESIKVLNLDEMANVNGGVIVSASGKYWVMPDPQDNRGVVCINLPFDSLDEARAYVQNTAWSARVYTREEFEEAFHIRLYF